VAIEYSDKLNEAIKKWEDRYGRKHLGNVEVAPDFKIEVYDRDFVKALLNRLDDYYKKEEETLDKMKDIKARLLA